MPTAQKKCSKCQAEISEAKYCDNCGFPENGDQNEKDKYFLKIKLKQNVVKDAENKILNVKYVIYIIAAINALMGIYFLTQEELFVDGLASLIASAIFVGCAIWVNSSPLTGVLAAFSFWVILQVLGLILDPASLFSGIILKVIFVVVFVKGIASARDAVKYREQLAEMNEN